MAIVAPRHKADLDLVTYWIFLKKWPSSNRRDVLDALPRAYLAVGFWRLTCKCLGESVVVKREMGIMVAEMAIVQLSKARCK